MRRDNHQEQHAGSFDRVVVLITFCVWIGHFIINSALVELTQSSSSSLQAYAARFVTYAIAIVSCLLFHFFIRRYRSSGIRFTILVMGLSVPLAIIVSCISSQLFIIIDPDDYATKMSFSYMATNYARYLQWLFFTWAALYAAVSYAQDIQEKERRLAAAQSAAADAHLRALRLQISPHFLFNTLNAATGLVSLNRNEQAEQVLVQLSKFLRNTLSSSPSQFSPLSIEVDIVKQYLSIEKVRFSDRLFVFYDIEEEAMPIMVPSLVLLPLVENATKHGLGNAEHDIRIEVGARLRGDDLQIWVHNSVCVEGCKPPGLGIGLENVRSRLATIYEDDANLATGPLKDGWSATITMPRSDR